MPAKKDKFDAVRKIGLALAGVEESTMYGKPALKLGGRLVACIASHKSAETETLVVRVDFERRSELLDADPDVYYLKDHYIGYPCVLARLARIHPDALRDLLAMSYKFVSGELRKRAGRLSPPAVPASRQRARRGARGTATPARKPRARS
jgi:hypothetical protein